jgi:CrcB protein
LEVGVRTLWIGAAGFAGAVSRYAVEGLISTRARGVFPWGTLSVNVSGCFALGFVFALLTERFLPHPTVRAALSIGFLGAYTTFSTFAFETMRLAEGRAFVMAGINLASSVLAGVGAVYAGTWLGRAL